MRSVLLLTFILLAFIKARAQQNYDVSAIPKELLPYASAIIRDREENIEVKDIGNSVITVKEVITVLNKNGDDHAHMVIYYDKSDVIKNIKGLVYNEFGKQIAKFSESDFEDESVGGSSSLFVSQRVKHYLPAVTQYPYTVAYEYEVRSKQTLDFDPWEPNSSNGEAIEKSTFTFSCKPDFKVRYKENNIANKVVTGVNRNGDKTYTWQVDNLKADRYEPFSPYYVNYTPAVFITPEKFSYYGIEGSFTNWKELGKWVYDKLLINRQELPQETVQHIKDITNDITDPKLKAKKIYEYMQNKTHYVSVQVGIGGIQPFPASDVDNQKYGDCKALVNYTQALLKAVNIDSWYCVVQSGRHYKVNLLPDFASMAQGDHIILCLPFKNDTTWADCTSETIPFGYLGDFTDDRNVLACTPEGGKLMHTPKYTFNDNLESRKASFVINKDGEVSGSIHTIFKGVDFEDRDEILNESVQEQYRMLQKMYLINNMNISSLELKQDKSFDPSTTENLKLSARDYASVNDGKYFFMLNSVDRIDEPLKQLRNRQNEVYINRGYTNTDEVTYTVPSGYRLEKVPLNVSMDKPFAKFTASMELKGDQLTYKRKLQLIDGTYNRKTYQDMVDFFQDVIDADDYTVSLVKEL